MGASYLAPSEADVLPLVPQQTPTCQSAFTPKHRVVSLSLCVWLFYVCVSKMVCLHTPSCANANTNGRLMWLALPLFDMQSSRTAG